MANFLTMTELNKIQGLLQHLDKLDPKFEPGKDPGPVTFEVSVIDANGDVLGHIRKRATEGYVFEMDGDE